MELKCFLHCAIFLFRMIYQKIIELRSNKCIELHFCVRHTFSIHQTETKICDRLSGTMCYSSVCTHCDVIREKIHMKTSDIGSRCHDIPKRHNQHYHYDYPFVEA